LLKNKTLVISDVEFSFLAEIVNIDISQVRGTPIAQRVLEVIAENFVIRQAWVSEEVLKANAEGDDATD
jgi:D-ribose pyranose/furanose isomerase RbsD